MAASDYTIKNSIPFTPSGLLASNIGKYTEAITLDNLDMLGATIEVGTAVMIEDEICRVAAISLPNVTIKRGCADTVPMPHVTGKRVWFFSKTLAGDSVEYVSGDTIAVKPLVYTSDKTLPIDYTPPLDITFNWRFHRPYPPGRVQADGNYYDTTDLVFAALATTMTFTWAHRDRITQADQLIDYTQASVGPETGTTYTVNIYDVGTGALRRTVTGLTTTSWVYDKTMAALDLTSPSAKFEVFSVCNGLDSLYHPTINFQVLGVVFGEDETKFNFTQDGYVPPVDGGQINFTLDGYTPPTSS